MALPKTLHPALTPDELTFLAEHDHINIVPLFSMTRVRLISVSPRLRTRHVLTRRHLGYIWTIQTTFSLSSPAVAGTVAQEEEKMQNSAARMAFCRYVGPPSLLKMLANSMEPRSHDALERLQAFLKDEKENSEGFERLPRRFMEISKVLLDT